MSTQLQARDEQLRVAHMHARENHSQLNALVAQLREVPGVRLEVTVEEPPPSRGKLL